MDLLTSTQKGELNAQMYNIHDTFGRDITIWKTAKQIVISTNPEHNFLFESNPTSSTVEEIPVSGVFKARILYAPNQQKNQMAATHDGRGGQQLGIEMEQGSVRIKLDPTGAAFISDAQRVTFDGQIFTVESSPRFHGVFGSQFQTFTLKKVN